MQAQQWSVPTLGRNGGGFRFSATCPEVTRIGPDGPVPEQTVCTVSLHCEGQRGLRVRAAQRCGATHRRYRRKVRHRLLRGALAHRVRREGRWSQRHADLRRLALPDLLRCHDDARVCAQLRRYRLMRRVPLRTPALDVTRCMPTRRCPSFHHPTTLSIQTTPAKSSLPTRSQFFDPGGEHHCSRGDRDAERRKPMVGSCSTRIASRPLAAPCCGRPSYVLPQASEAFISR